MPRAPPTHFLLKGIDFKGNSNDDTKIGLISALAETDFRIGEGANAWIQIEAAIAQFVNAGKKLDRELEK